MSQNLMFAFVGLFVAMDTIGVIPTYLGLTRGLDKKSRNQILKQSILVAALVAFVFAFVGRFIFKFLGISIHDFKVGGGIVLLVISIMDLVQGKQPDKNQASTGVVPLAVPLITGPGVITTVMLQVGLYGHFVVTLSMLLNFLFAWIALKKSSIITAIIGDEGTEIISKVAALFMTAIAFSMIRSGLFEAIKSANLH